jgi:hypothetical protein
MLEENQLKNWRPPTEKQQIAGNYFKPRLNIAGIEIAIENPVGTTRTGRDEDGGEWTTTMQNHYGYVVGSKGVDGDAVDVYVGTDPESDQVFVVHQAKYGKWDQFDEDKCMLFFSSQDEAEQAYLSHYDDPRFLLGITAMTLDKFKRKVLANDGKMIKSRVDLSGLSCDCENEAFEMLSKAISEDQHDIWEPHNNPFISELIELFTERGLLRIDTVKTELMGWLEKRRHAGFVPNVHLPDMAPVWTKDELSLVKLYLESLPANSWTLSDYDYLVQYLFQRYLPANELMSEAEWLITRAYLMSKVNAVTDSITPEQSGHAIAAMPLTVGQASEVFSLASAEKQILDYARLKAMDMVVAVSDSARHGLKSVLLDHMQKHFSGDESATPGKLQQSLFDKFSTMNRDWRRIALTETNEVFGQGFIASLPVGARVRRVEQYRGACPFCKKIDGMEFDVVDPAMPNKDDWKHMWVGKSNLGRSASPYKKTDDGLMKREPYEMWVPTPGAIHPHCRGRLFVITAHQHAVSDDFAQWFANHVKS